MRRRWLGVVGIVGVVGCGSSSESSPWDGRAQVLPCGIEPVQCLAGSADAPPSDELTPDMPSVSRHLATDEYVGPSASGCDLAYVYDLPPEKLTGLQLQISAGWNVVQLSSPPDLERCADYDLTLHVYTPNSEADESFRLVDHRIFKGEANESTGLCDAQIRSAGPGEPGLPRNEDVWLTAGSYPAGLRIVVSALDACEPLPLGFQVTEQFKAAGEPQPGAGAEAARSRAR